MGRGADDLVRPNKKRADLRPESLTAGQDINGQEAYLGQLDSSGNPVGFISQDGYCWISVAEHDEVKTVGAFEKAMIAWQRGEIEGGRPSVEEIAQQTCLDPENSEQSAKIALDNWEKIEKRQRRLLEERGEDFRSLNQEVANDRHALFQDDRHLSYPSKITGGEIVTLRLTETEEEREEAVHRIVEMNDQMAQEGFPPLPEKLLEAIINQKDDLFSVLRGEEMNEDETRSVFEEIVADMKEEQEPVWIWSSSLYIPFGANGDSISIETQREGQEAALTAAIEAEKQVLEGSLSDQPIALEMIVAPRDPEQEKWEALDILAQGEEHPFVKKATVLGLNPEKILEKAERVAMGQGERPLFIAKTNLFVESLGEINITISGENPEEIARRARTILPGAYFLSDEDDFQGTE